MALVVEDIDHPKGKCTHWLVWNIPKMSRIAENNVQGIQGITDFGHGKYRGPCPFKGKHDYLFRIYALDEKLFLESSATKKRIA